MADWSKGFTSAFYMVEIDPYTWLEKKHNDVSVRIEITGGSIKNEGSGKRQTATVDCKNYKPEVEQWVRIYMDTYQSGASDHVAMFTGLASCPDDEIVNTLHNNSLDCFSVLQPLADVVLLRGWYAAKGADVSGVLADLLSVTPAPVDGLDEINKNLTSYIIAENNETNLTMLERILTAANLRLQITGDGRIRITPMPLKTEYTYSFDPLQNDMIETKINVTADWFACPNVFLAIQDDMSAIKRDDDEDSIVSTVNRGREVWMQESGCNLAEGESITDYAARRLAEEQNVKKIVSYDRRFTPDVLPDDHIMMNYPEQGVTGIFKVQSQSIDIGTGVKTGEEITEV